MGDPLHVEFLVVPRGLETVGDKVYATFTDQAATFWFSANNTELRRILERAQRARQAIKLRWHAISLELLGRGGA